MVASLRELRERNRSVRATQKITRAMELIAASRITRAQQAAQAALPYTRELNAAVQAVMGHSDVRHPLTTEVEEPVRTALLVLTSDRGLAGAYSSNVLRKAEQTCRMLTEEEGREVRLYVCGRKGIAYYTYRRRELAGQWSGFSDKPDYTQSDEVATALLEDFLRPVEEGGVDEIQVVYTRFVSRLTQEPRVRRILPLEVVDDDSGEDGPDPLYEFEPGPEEVLDALLPLYIRNRIHFYLMQSAASELASKQKAMKSATDNAQQLIEDLTRLANQARQAKITQEITEIVGGAQALAGAKTKME
ncbi:MAG: F0F1 ATP synthase subunit gamma [Propionibacteriaceae bacterium]|jgi:F-type H+-transporting ATPase subunit gamma|nr:F0F1 ATP synthase subunit gamma [Propionibacteriaceae bacterium]